MEFESSTGHERRWKRCLHPFRISRIARSTSSFEIILGEVNKRRKYKGFKPLRLGCIPNTMRPTKTAALVPMKGTSLRRPRAELVFGREQPGDCLPFLSVAPKEGRGVQCTESNPDQMSTESSGKAVKGMCCVMKGSTPESALAERMAVRSSSLT